ncbi:MAG: ParB N-terminal domain-containing protein [Candidatus Hydrogenedentes bacterium]|nr:ParB N-terminal domain-containing protein [Candidatus Hydrogenedentota bacterium]
MANRKSAAKKKIQTDDSSGYERVPVKDLYFDAENPRLIEYLDGASADQASLLTVLWQNMAVDELGMSIAASGYFDYEPVFVITDKKRLVVIEGNRRLAAVKLLLDKKAREELKATDLPKISAAEAKNLLSIPVIRTTRKDAWQYLGFKHVNGPAKWDSYPKAQYVAQVHKKFKVPLDKIADQIGDKHNTVQRLYRALMVIEQAEKAKVFKRENRYKGHFSFSHLYVGLDYEGFSRFLNLKDVSKESRTPVPQARLPQLGELCVWLFGDESLDTPPIVQSQNPHLRELAAVLRSKDATQSLRAGLPLSLALEISYGDEEVFQKALVRAKEALTKARGTLTTGYHGEKEQLRLANEIYSLAFDLVEEMERFKTPRRRRNVRGKSTK